MNARHSDYKHAVPRHTNEYNKPLDRSLVTSQAQRPGRNFS